MKVRSRFWSFSLLELLVVVAIIGVLIGLLVPYANTSRKRAKTAHCLSRLHDIGASVSTYASDNVDRLPPAAANWHPTLIAGMQRLNVGLCDLPVMYGWAELLFEHLRPGNVVTDWSLFPAQRNFQDRYERLFNCPAALQQISHGSHFRVYLPHWAHEALQLDEDMRITSSYEPLGVSSRIDRLQPHWVLTGDCNEESDWGDYLGKPVIPSCPYPGGCPVAETSGIGINVLGDSGESINQANSRVFNCCSPDRVQLRFEHRHSGAANYLFGDLHAERSATLRARLSCDWDLNGVCDCKTSYSAKLSGCESPCPNP